MNAFKKIKEKNIIKNKEEIRDVLKCIKIEKLNLNIVLGLHDVITLSSIVAILDILISIALAITTNNTNSNNYHYNITPCKTDSFYFNLYINCIIAIKLANIINILIKKRGKKDERASNRILDGNCYE